MITVVGDTTLDVVSSTLKLLPKEDTEVKTKFTAKLGGQAAHTALALSRLDVKTKFITCVGDDIYGKILVDKLKKEKVQLKLKKSGNTALSFIIPTKYKRTIFNDDGANALLFRINRLSGKYLFVGGYWHLRKLNIADLLKKAKRKKMATFLDVGYHSHPLRRELLQTLKSVDYCFLDQKELLHYTKEKELFKALEKMPCSVALHLGKKGSGLYQNRKFIFVPAKKNERLETTGAGDFWNAGFVYGTMKKWPVRKTLHFANKYAVKCLKEEIHYL